MTAMILTPSSTEVMARLTAPGQVISVLSAPTQRLADARALILLSQILYWTIKAPNVLRADGWLSKPAHAWQQETRLTRNHLHSSFEVLRQSGVVKFWQKGAKTPPWVKLDLPTLFALCQGRPSHHAISLAQFIADAAYRDNVTGRPVPFYTALADMTGDALMGYFLSRCIFWQELLQKRNRLGDKPAWGWSSSDWFSDCGISRSQLRTLMKHAAALGLISVTEIAGRTFPGIRVEMPTIHRQLVLLQGKHELGVTAHIALDSPLAAPAQPQLPAPSISGQQEATADRDAVKEVAPEADAKDDGIDLVFPAIPAGQAELDAEEQQAIVAQLNKVQPDRRQLLLDEMAGAMMSGRSVTNRVGYVRQLVSLELANKFEPNQAHLVQARRRRQAGIAAQLALVSKLPENLPPPEPAPMDRQAARTQLAKCQALLGRSITASGQSALQDLTSVHC